MARWSEQTIERKSEEFGLIAQKFQGMTIAELEEAYFLARESKDRIEAELKPVNQVIAVIEALVAERFAEDDLKTVKFDNGRRITVTYDSPRTIADKAIFLTWLEESGREYELTVYAASVNRIVKE